MLVILNICFNIITYLNKWFFLESPFLLFYVEVIIFYNCQVLMLMTDKCQRIFISENVKIPVAQTFCDIRDFLLLFSNGSDFLVIPEDELPGLVKLKTL
jgi:hypothetical protein